MISDKCPDDMKSEEILHTVTEKCLTTTKFDIL